MNLCFQGKTKQTKKFATMKRMINLKDSRMWVWAITGVTADSILCFDLQDFLQRTTIEGRLFQVSCFVNLVAMELVFGLGRIFRLERSAIFMTEFWARLELGAINFHLKPCMFTWAKIGSPFEVIILALYSNVASYHLISTRFLITT